MFYSFHDNKFLHCILSYVVKFINLVLKCLIDILKDKFDKFDMHEITITYL